MTVCASVGREGREIATLKSQEKLEATGRHDAGLAEVETLRFSALRTEPTKTAAPGMSAGPRGPIGDKVEARPSKRVPTELIND